MSLRLHCYRYRCTVRKLALLAPPLILIGCGSVPPAAPPASQPVASRPAAKKSGIPVLPPAGSGRGGYYLDDGPGDSPPEGLLDTPDAEPQIEPPLARANRPYAVFGKTYTPITDDKPFKQRGIGSWYGKKFHGQKTSSGEPYDMYKMTAAHPTLPIPSYARVTNLSNGAQVIVRVNDRGPFHSSRIIDLSYTAALKLGYLGSGSGQLEVERLLPADIARLAEDKKQRLASAQKIPTQEVLSDAAAMPSKPGVEVTTVAMTGNVKEATPVIVAAPPAIPASGFYLQLGAYGQAANAEAARDRLMQGAAGKLAPVEVVEYGLFFRLYSGPFASRAEAAAAALQMQEGGAAKPLIVQR
jgi:rare lipoprotein A